jgi:hypothetical protein
LSGGWPADAEPSRVARAARAGALAGVAVGALGILMAALGDGPYLRLAELDPGIVLYALGLFAVLLATPFALHARIAVRVEDRDKRWELALLQWGGVALAATAVLVVLGIAAGFSTATLGGAVAVVGLAECALVLAALAVLILGSG